MPITAGGSEPMIMAEALASDDIALILPCRRLRSRSTPARLPSASDRLPPDLLLDGHDDGEEAHFRGRHGFEHPLQPLIQRDADLQAFDQVVEFAAHRIGRLRAPRSRSASLVGRPDLTRRTMTSMALAKFVGEFLLAPRLSGSPAPSAANRGRRANGASTIDTAAAGREGRPTAATGAERSPQAIQKLRGRGLGKAGLLQAPAQWWRCFFLRPGSFPGP